MKNETPYNFGKNPLGGVIKAVTGTVQNHFATKGKAAEMVAASELDIRAHAAKTVLSTSAEKKLIKHRNKAELNLISAKGEQDRQTTAHAVASATQLGFKAKGGTKVDIAPGRASYTTPEAPKAAKAPAKKAVAKKAPAPVAETVVKPAARPRKQSPSVNEAFTSPVGDAPVSSGKPKRSPVAGSDIINMGGIKQAQATED